MIRIMGYSAKSDWQRTFRICRLDTARANCCRYHSCIWPDADGQQDTGQSCNCKRLSGQLAGTTMAVSGTPCISRHARISVVSHWSAGTGSAMPALLIGRFLSGIEQWGTGLYMHGHNGQLKLWTDTDCMTTLSAAVCLTALAAYTCCSCCCLSVLCLIPYRHIYEGRSINKLQKMESFCYFKNIKKLKYPFCRE